MEFKPSTILGVKRDVIAASETKSFTNRGCTLLLVDWNRGSNNGAYLTRYENIDAIKDIGENVTITPTANSFSITNHYGTPVNVCIIAME